MALRAGQSARRHRQRALRARLRAAGLMRRRIRTITPTEVLGADKSPSARLRECLHVLGPLYAAFADYLALRTDLLPLADCHELTVDAGRPWITPTDAVRELLEHELGGAAAELLVNLSGPLRSTPLFQWHRAHLRDGSEVSVKILRPEFEHQRRTEQALLAVLEDVHLLTQDGSTADMTAALDGFRDHIARRADLPGEVKALGRMAAAAEDYRGFVVPASHPNLCTGRVVTTNAFPEARPLSALPTGDQAAPEVDLARRLALCWLQQALLGPVYPEGPFDDEMLLLHDGRLAVTGGLFGRLDRYRQDQLLGYLTAAARDEADRACDLLLDQCTREGSATSTDRMRRLFRQAEPFRSAGWSPHYAGQRLADSLFVHWRLSHRHGYRMQRAMAGFVTGLFNVELQGRRISPRRDGLRQGLDDVRIIAAAVRVREFFGPTHLQENLHQLIETGSLVLRRLADASRAEADAESRDGEKPSREDHGKRRSDLAFAGAGLLLIAAAAFMIAGRLSLPDPGSVTEPALASLTYTLAALALFWYLGRKQRD